MKGVRLTSRLAAAATDINPAELQEYVQLGGFVELRQNGPRADLARKIGAESIIASTDCGFLTNPFPPHCLAIMARQLRAEGISEREIDLMFKENPAKLLGLPPWRPQSATPNRPDRAMLRPVSRKAKVLAAVAEKPQ